MPVSDDRLIREKAREVIQAGTLPNRFPERTWGGPGVGADCTICGVPVHRDELEFEIEFVESRNGSGHHAPETYHVHVRCFTVWDQERRTSDRPPALPFPGGAPLEAT